MKKQYKAPEIEVLLFDFRKIAMLTVEDTGHLGTTVIDPDENPWKDPAEVIDINLDNINEVTY